MSDLGEYIRDASAKPWRDAEHDCTAWPARWANVPLPAYASAADAAAMIQNAGGLVSLVDAHAAGRIERIAIEDAQAGDVGVIALNDRRDGALIEVGAIFTGERWAFVPLQGGVCCVKAAPIAVWRPLCRS